MSLNESNVFIQGSAGKLEAAIHLQENPKNIGIICHPHPQHGGTMNNKVVTTLARTFRDLGVSSIRFNYRGVGKSDGSYAHAAGETEDVLSVIHYTEKEWPNSNLWLAGFSFGAFVSLKAASSYKKISQLISIAPAVNHADFNNLHPHCPWIVVIAENDDIVPANEIKQWATKLNPSPEIISFPGTGHFFDGKLIDLRHQLIEKLTHAHTF